MFFLIIIYFKLNYFLDEIVFEREKFKNISAELDRTLDDLNVI